MALDMTKKTVVNIIGILLVSGINTTTFAASKDIVTEDIKENKAKAVIAKAPTDQDFKALDTNSDGKISLQEAVKDTALATQFNATDVNHDGAITADEYALYASNTKEPTTSVN